MNRWTFDRADRLGELAGRADRMVGHLAREALDAPKGSPERDRFRARLGVMGRRLARLRLAARAARHNLRYDLARAAAAIGAGA